jgi:hypothetical protein
MTATLFRFWNFLTAAVVVTIMAVMTTAATAADVPCASMVPWMPMAAGGIRLSSWDPFKDNQLNQAVDLTCNYQQTWTDEISGKTYDLPDQFLNVNQQSGSVTSAATSVASDTVALAQTLAATFASSSCGLFVCHSSSKTMQDAVNATYASDSIVGLATSQFSSYEMQMLQPTNLSMRAQAWYDSCVGWNASSAPYSVADRPAYQRFAQVFGTHFMTQSTWGGRVVFEYVAQRTALDAEGEAAVNAQAAGAFGNFIQAAGGGGTATQLAAWFTSALTSSSVTFWGGVGQPTPGTWAAWTASVAQVPSLTAYSLTSLSALLTPAAAAAAFDAFVQDELDTQLIRNVVAPSLAAIVANNLHFSQTPDAFAACGAAQLPSPSPVCPAQMGTAPPYCTFPSWYPCKIVSPAPPTTPLQAAFAQALAVAQALQVAVQGLVDQSFVSILDHGKVADVVAQWVVLVQAVQSTPAVVTSSTQYLQANPSDPLRCGAFGLAVGPNEVDTIKCIMTFPSKFAAL